MMKIQDLEKLAVAFVEANGEIHIGRIRKLTPDMLNSKVMEAYHQALDEQQGEDVAEVIPEDESESFVQSM